MHKLHLFILFALFALLPLAVAPALAQDITPAATPNIATPAPVVVNVEQPPATSPTSTPEWWQIALVLFFGGSLVIDVITLAAKRASPQEIDTTVVNRLQMLQDNREAMDRVERAYQSANRQIQVAFDTLAQTVRFIAPFTPIQSDNKLADVLADIQQPGAPVTPPYVPTSTTAAAAIPQAFVVGGQSPQG